MTEQRPTSRHMAPFGRGRRSMALGADDPRARREADSGLNAGTLASDGLITQDARTGRLTVNIEELKKRLQNEEG